MDNVDVECDNNNGSVGNIDFDVDSCNYNNWLFTITMIIVILYPKKEVAFFSPNLKSRKIVPCLRKRALHYVNLH